MLDCARLACLLELGVAEGGRAPGGACGVSAVHQHGCDMHRFRRIKLTRAWSATSSFSKQKVPGTTKVIETLDLPVQWMIVIFTQWQLDKDVICRSAMFGAGSPSHAISKRRPCKMVCGTKPGLKCFLLKHTKTKPSSLQRAFAGDTPSAGTCRPIVRRRLRGLQNFKRA